MGDNNNERVAKVEAAVDSIEKGLGRLEDKIDHLFEVIEKRFLPRNEYSETVKRLETRLDDQQNEIRELRSQRKGVPVWATTIITILTAIVAALLGSLAYHFFN